MKADVKVLTGVAPGILLTCENDAEIYILGIVKALDYNGAYPPGVKFCAQVRKLLGYDPE